MRELGRPVRTNRSIPDVVVVPVLTVSDVREAVDWLEDAFGFTERLRIGEGHRSQLDVPGGGAVILAQARPDTSVAGDRVSHSVLVRVEDATSHFERAKAAGARILMEPTDFEYGERQYAVEDPFGHRWTFSETLSDADPAPGSSPE